MTCLFRQAQNDITFTEGVMLCHYSCGLWSVYPDSQRAVIRSSVHYSGSRYTTMVQGNIGGPGHFCPAYTTCLFFHLDQCLTYAIPDAHAISPICNLVKPCNFFQSLERPADTTYLLIEYMPLDIRHNDNRAWAMELATRLPKGNDS